MVFSGRSANTFWYNLDKFPHIQMVAKYQLGFHWLNIKTERRNRAHVPRSTRVCRCCDMGEREDEAHLLACPCYEALRQRFGFTTVCDDVNEQMWHFMRAPECPDRDYWIRVARFLFCARRVRADMLALTSQATECDMVSSI